MASTRGCGYVLVTRSRQRKRERERERESEREQFYGRPLLARTDCSICGAATRHTTAIISHTVLYPLAETGKLLPIFRPAKDKRLTWVKNTAAQQQLLKVVYKESRVSAESTTSQLLIRYCSK